MPELPALIHDELHILAGMVPLTSQRIVELGCGAAALGRKLMTIHTGCRYVGFEVDQVQLERNLRGNWPQGMEFHSGGAQSIGADNASFDLALMLKSLHHVPVQDMDAALAEVARVVRPGGYLYVSEPVYSGALNALVRVYNDEGQVRAAAQSALDRAVAQAAQWEECQQHRFDMPVHFDDFAQFEQRMMYPTFKDHAITEEIIDRVRAMFMPHMGPMGADFLRPMLVRLLRRTQ